MKLKVSIIIICVACALILIGVLLVVFLLPSGNTDDQILKLSNGKIRGRTATSPKGVKFFAFQEIPYAAPPVRDLRFKPPQPVANWTHVLDTRKNTKICYQVYYDSDQENEDCLYLNVYTPRLPDEDDELLPVMFYIHGGGFIEGSGVYSSYGPDFLIEHGVVVVTINYRLGPFGFLSTQDAVIPGNNGLRDQLFALKWTNTNIHHFGGNSSQITIFGQSAGSSSVAYHLICNKSRGLYRAAILQSGSAISPFAYQRSARSYAFKTATYMNSSFRDPNSSEELLEFMRKAPTADIDGASLKVIGEQYYDNGQIIQGYYYAPVIEEDQDEGFLTEKMFEVVFNGGADRVPIIMGMTSEEGISQSTDIDFLNNLMKQYDNRLEWLVPNDMNVITNKNVTGGRIRQIYVGDGLLENNPAAGIKYLSDVSFTRSIIMHALLQSQYSKVYFYQFSYDGRMGNTSVIVPGAESVGHSEDTAYLWRISTDQFVNYNLSIFPESDIKTHDRLLTLFTNFAKHLNPTPKKDSLLQNIVWPLVTSYGPGNFPYLDIRKDLSIENHPKKESFDGWNAVYDEFGNRPYDTY